MRNQGNLFHPGLAALPLGMPETLTTLRLACRLPKPPLPASLPGSSVPARADLPIGPHGLRVSGATGADIEALARRTRAPDPGGHPQGRQGGHHPAGSADRLIAVLMAATGGGDGKVPGDG